MSDNQKIACEEGHEMEYILRKFNKSTSRVNIEILRRICREFKEKPEYTPHYRKDFYQYLKDYDVLSILDES